MKWFLFAVLFIICSCRSNSLNGLLSDQRGIYNLSETFKTEYRDTSNSIDREELVKKYELQLKNYLTHTCNFSLKGVKVHVSKLELDYPNKLVAEFTDQHCRYLVQRNYSSEDEMKADFVYHLITELKENTDITLRFLFDGNVKVNALEGTADKIFEIEVTPTEINRT